MIPCRRGLVKEGLTALVAFPTFSTVSVKMSEKMNDVATVLGVCDFVPGRVIRESIKFVKETRTFRAHVGPR